MTTETKIRKDLKAGQSTADSIAGRINVPTGAVEVILARLKRGGSVSSRPLKNLTVWFLTPPPQP